MSEYKRLTLRNLTSAYDYAKSNLSQEEIAKIYDRLAELEDKIESGKLVKLPCKLGQLVYAVYDGAIHEYFSEEINVHEDGRFIFETPTLFPKRLTFGEDVFTDKAQAEARFKELKGEQQ